MSGLWRIASLGLVGLLLLVPAAAWLDGARELTGRRHAFRDAPRRVVVLGFDGVDPDLLREFLDRLPNVSALAEEGTLTACRTTIPPESPVAWATFATGWNPGNHGIFDFVRRDPASEAPYRPLNGMVERLPPKMGPLDLPLRAPRARNLRGGQGFWEPIAAAGYRVSVLRMPLTFPPKPLRGGELLCGLGVPDLRGTAGSYTLYAAGAKAWNGYSEFGGRHLKIYPRNAAAESVLEGPPDPRRPGSGKRLERPVRFRFEKEGATVRLGKGEETRLEMGKHGPWMDVEFRAGPFVRVRGLVRFTLLRLEPEPAVYASPIQIAPGGSPVPLCMPRDFLARVHRRIGKGKTAGWPEETFGVNEGVLDDVQFYRTVEEDYRRHERLLLDRLQNAPSALHVMVFTAQDRMSHLFYRWRDPRHPANDPAARRRFARRTGVQDPILESYRWMDRTLGEVRKQLRPEDILLVVSDHGFHSWRIGVNLNTWLLREGYLTLRRESAGSPKDLESFFREDSETAHIDWSKTRAYALGLGQIYVNLKGRDAAGIVEPADRARLLEELRGKLMTLRTPEGEKAFAAIHTAEEIWKGQRMAEAPDLQCAFASGFRVSWQTALLGVPDEVFEVNDAPWSGDHCSNHARATAGILLCNRTLSPDANPGLEDIAPTVLALFGLPPPEGGTGRDLSLER